jgi:hypothetical protein
MRADGQSEKHDEAIGRLSQFLRTRLKMLAGYLTHMGEVKT